MLCQSCHAANLRDFTAEINIHFPGKQGLTIPTVWIFPSIVVCVDCGAAQFTVPKPELKKLADQDSLKQLYRTAV